MNLQLAVIADSIFYKVTELQQKWPKLNIFVMDLKLLSFGNAGKVASPSSTLHPSSRQSALPSSVLSSADGFPTSSSSSATAVDEAVHVLPPFTPYSAQVPWHTGFRAFFSNFFPKYGRYCGPNWSSGRSSGSLFWDKPPIDALDFCCFCHDVGYDSHDQAQLYKADLEFLECLQKLPPSVGSNHRHAHASPHGSRPDSNPAIQDFYRNLYITGLQTFLLPYRRMVLKEIGARKE